MSPRAALAAMTPTLAESVFDRLGGDLWLLIPAFVFSMLAGIFVGRVLGVRRSVAASVLSGLFGFAVGVAVSLLIANERGNASEGFARNLFLFALFGAMAAAVWIEFLARPGIIARAQTGLASVPHPLRSLRRRGRRMARYAEITRIAVRNGLGPSLGLGRRDEMSRERRPEPDGPAPAAVARAVRRDVREARPDRVDPLGPAVARRDQGALAAPGPRAAGGPRRRRRAARGGARRAGRGGVRRLRLATHRGGVDRPGVPGRAARRLAGRREGDPPRHRRVGRRRPVGARRARRVVETRTSWGAEYHVLDLVDEFSARLREELDFRIEARNARTIALEPAQRVARSTFPRSTRT